MSRSGIVNVRMVITEEKILSNKKIVDGIYEMVVAEDSKVKPGQFYMLKKMNYPSPSIQGLSWYMR